MWHQILRAVQITTDESYHFGLGCAGNKVAFTQILSVLVHYGNCKAVDIDALFCHARGTFIWKELIHPGKIQIKHGAGCQHFCQYGFLCVSCNVGRDSFDYIITQGNGFEVKEPRNMSVCIIRIVYSLHRSRIPVVTRAISCHVFGHQIAHVHDAAITIIIRTITITKSRMSIIQFPLSPSQCEEV